MAAEGSVPVDSLTGIPLPILPNSEPPKPGLPEWHDNHHSFHPAKSLELQDEAGKALRYSRMQRVSRWLHNRYHQNYADAILPTDENGKFHLTVLACAGYMPRQAIDVSGRQPLIVEVNDTDHRRMLKPENLSKQKAGIRHIGTFFARVALDQEMDHISSRTIDEFLTTRNQKRQKVLGYHIMSQAISRGVEPIEPLYRNAWQNSLISPQIPKNPAKVVFGILNARRHDYIDELHAQLLRTA